MKPGDSINVKVTVISTGNEVKSSGVFIDIHASERGRVKCKNQKCQQTLNISNKTIKQAISIAPAFVLQPNETKVSESAIRLPMGQPKYHGTISHEWMIRGRLEAFSNDPGSGFPRIDVR